MKVFVKRIGAALTASAIAFGLAAAPAENAVFSLGSAVSALEKSETEYASPGRTSVLPDSKELEKLWIDRLFYGDGVSFYKDYGRDHLKGASLELYELLREHIEAISAGNENITSFPLGMTKTFGSKAELDAGIDAAMNALMVDLPADFYWYDKTAGYVYFSNAGGTAVTKVILAISENYVDAAGGTETVDYSDGTSETYKINVDSDKMTSARNAVANALTIAAKYDGESDYNKLLGYKEEICGLVSYNSDAAADNSNTPYGDPWQLVWVFDNDPDTNVVCEGYSKAFQYLCDLSGIECYTVTGDMDGGGHMWNIVVLDGKSYLVDVTNCDDGTIGYPDNLFLKGAHFSDSTGCFFIIDDYNNVTYVYDQEIADLYSSAGILTVSAEDFTPSVECEHEYDAVWSYDDKEHWHTCSKCQNKTDIAKHEMDKVPNSEKAPSCLEDGKDADMQCSCGYTEEGAAIPKTDEHTAGVPTEENRVPQSCTVNGSHDMVTRCTVCGEVISTEHIIDYAEGHILNGTFLIDGTSHCQICVMCHNKFGEEPHSEDNGTVTLTPFTETDGVRTYKCTVCGEVLRTEPIPALGENHEHEYTIENYNKNYHWIECACGAAESSPVPHTVSTREYTVIEASCSFNGVKSVVTYCTECGAEVSRVSEAIPKTGIHTTGDEFDKDSENHWKTCTVCGEVVDKEPHIPGSAAAEGVPQTCTVCGYEMSPALSHTHRFSTEWSKDENSHWHAAVCQHTGEVKDRAPHEWDAGVVTTAPTETSNGIKTYTCGVCKATKTEPVSKLDHTHTPGTAWRSDSSGHWHGCGGCGEKLDFAAHSVVSEVTKAPSADASGTRRYYCSICGYIVREEIIPAIGVTEPDYPSYPIYPAGSPNVFPPSVSSKREPKLENVSGNGGWDFIADSIGNADSGSVVQVDMNGTYELPKKILNEISGKNIDLVLKMNDKITWTINGETVNTPKNVNMRARLNTNSIPEAALERYAASNSIIQLTLSHRGSFGFDAVMTVQLGSRYDGKYANLLYYDQVRSEFEFIDCGMISNGKADLDFSHASEYALVISDEPMGDYDDVSAAAGIYESSGSDTRESVVYAAIVAILSVAAAFAVYGKRVRK